MAGQGGLGRPWATLRRLARWMAISQLVSPVVALLVVLVAGSATQATQVDSSPSSGLLASAPTVPPAVKEVVRGEVEAGLDLPEVPEVVVRASDEQCCGQEARQPCPRGYPVPSAQQVAEQCGGNTTLCSDLPLLCLDCLCDYNCSYGRPSQAECTPRAGVQCAGAGPTVAREFRCAYCYLTDRAGHSCSTRDLGCRSTGSPTSSHHWYIANCTSGPDTLCLGKQVFSKRVECSWTEGYSWRTALVLSVTLGGFGADRFYLGHWQEGIGKLFSFGGLGVWTLVDVVLVSIGYIGPADGSLYI